MGHETSVVWSMKCRRALRAAPIPVCFLLGSDTKRVSKPEHSDGRMDAGFGAR